MASKRKFAKKTSVFVISYVPLIDMGCSGELIDGRDAKRRLAQVDDAMGMADACAWLGADVPSPCLLIERARDVAAHLAAWAENDPSKWFRLALAERGDLYGLALMPNLKLSAQRFKIAHQLRCGYPLPKNMEMSFAFKPLHFMSRPDHVFGNVKGKIGDRTQVSLIDTEEFKGPDTSLESIVSLGEFDVVWEGYETKYVEDMLEQSTME